MDKFRDSATGQFKPGEKPINFKGWYISVVRGGKLKYKLIYCPDHPYAGGRKKYVMEHRLIMEKYLGRYLTSSEQVHHINGDPLDNRIENLQLCANNAEHKKIHATKPRTEKLCTVCKQILPIKKFPHRWNNAKSALRHKRYSSWCYNCCRFKKRESYHKNKISC